MDPEFECFLYRNVYKDWELFFSYRIIRFRILSTGMGWNFHELQLYNVFSLLNLEPWDDFWKCIDFII